MIAYLRNSFKITTCISLIALLSACGTTTDRRLSEDKQSCRSMGHTPGTAEFKNCLADLNARRCATSRQKGWGEHHDASLDCTRLP